MADSFVSGREGLFQRQIKIVKVTKVTEFAI